ncbi:MAG: hypothetical protein MAG715_00080 [Methanonatronarchaeales archaeon]|nr:hypothetical protein [Methanonatronarchaeales archaeon]
MNNSQLAKAARISSILVISLLFAFPLNITYSPTNITGTILGVLARFTITYLILTLILRYLSSKYGRFNEEEKPEELPFRMVPFSWDNLFKKGSRIESLFLGGLTAINILILIIFMFFILLGVSGSIAQYNEISNLPHKEEGFPKYEKTSRFVDSDNNISLQYPNGWAKDEVPSIDTQITNARAGIDQSVLFYRGEFTDQKYPPMIVIVVYESNKSYTYNEFLYSARPDLKNEINSPDEYFTNTKYFDKVYVVHGVDSQSGLEKKLYLFKDKNRWIMINYASPPKQFSEFSHQATYIAHHLKITNQ